MRLFLFLLSVPLLYTGILLRMTTLSVGFNHLGKPTYLTMDEGGDVEVRPAKRFKVS